MTSSALRITQDAQGRGLLWLRGTVVAIYPSADRAHQALRRFGSEFNRLVKLIPTDSLEAAMVGRSAQVIPFPRRNPEPPRAA